MEGLAAGLPIIGHDIGGIRDFVIDGENGLLCKEEYGKTLKTIIVQNRKIKSDRVMKFDVGKTKSIMTKVYSDISI